MDAATLEQSTLGSKVSRTYVLRGDRIVPADGLDRGGPIVWTVEEWRSRYRAVRRRQHRIMALLWASCTLFAFGVIWVVDLPYGILSLGSFLSGLLVITSLTMAGFALVILVEFIADRMPRAAPHRGLYERGVQVNRALFLPFEELGDVVVEASFAHLVPRCPLEKGPWRVPNPQQWMVELELLGEEGLKELKAKVAGARGDREPPRLVVYGPPGHG